LLPTLRFFALPVLKAAILGVNLSRAQFALSFRLSGEQKAQSCENA
jgi:hypothetical protein